MGYFADLKKKKRDKKFDRILQQSIKSREEFWKTVGELDNYVLTHLINPMFLGGVSWPANRQGFLRIIKENSVVFASDGLSDPFYPSGEEEIQPYNGYGLEFYLECDDPSLRGELDEVKNHWAFDLIYQISQNAASRGNMLAHLEKYSVLSMEFTDIESPKGYLTENGVTGVLLGVVSPEIKTAIDLPLESVRLVSIILLTPEQLDYVYQYGSDARLNLSEEFKKAGTHHLNSI